MITRLVVRFGKPVLAAAVFTIFLAGCRITIVGDAASSGERNGASSRGVRGNSGQPGEPGQPGQDGQPGQPGQAGDSGIRLKGSGNVVTESRLAAGFDSVEFRGSAQLLIDQSGTESLSVEAEDNLLPHLISEVKGSQLSLGPESGYSIQATKPIVFRLTVKSLKEVTAAGSGEIQAKNLKSDNLAFNQSGSLRITAQGSATRSQLTVSGSGEYNGESLDSADVGIDISGSGQAVVRASSKLSIRISGSGSVEYIGDPNVSQEIGGSGTVRKR